MFAAVWLGRVFVVLVLRVLLLVALCLFALFCLVCACCRLCCGVLACVVCVAGAVRVVLFRCFVGLAARPLRPTPAENHGARREAGGGLRREAASRREAARRPARETPSPGEAGARTGQFSGQKLRVTTFWWRRLRRRVSETAMALSRTARSTSSSASS